MILIFAHCHQALKQVNTAVGGKSPSRQVSADTVARLEEMQQIIHRLKEENKNLTQQVQDAMEESWFNNVRDGHKLLVATENSIGAEFDTMTKEEVSSSTWTGDLPKTLLVDTNTKCKPAHQFSGGTIVTRDRGFWY